MPAVAAAIAPIFLIVAAGFVLRRTGPFPAGAWPPVERLTYYVLFPSLLLVSLARADPGGLPVAGMAAGAVGAPAALLLALLLARPRLRLDGPGFTSLVQGSIRFNNYIGIPLALAFFGADSIALAALFIAAMVPFANVACVWTLARHGAAEVRGRAVLAAMCRNPLILACAAGIAVNLSGLGLAGPVAATLDLLGRAAPPAGLLCVGAGLDLAAARAGRSWIALACVLKLGLMPLVATGLAHLLGLSAAAAGILILFHALPTAPAAYIMARQLGGDARLVAGMLTAQTLLAMITLPAWIAFLGP